MITRLLRTAKPVSVLLAALTAGSLTASGQRALKTNLVYDAGSTVNAGLEFPTSSRWTADFSVSYNGWRYSGRLWKHWCVMPELRQWHCTPFYGSFYGVHLLGGQFNFGNFDLPFSFLGTDFRVLKDTRHQGWMAGFGLVYGYSWMLDRCWNLEAAIGLGCIYTRYDVFECVDCGAKAASGITHNYIGPTKVALSLIYNF